MDINDDMRESGEPEAPSAPARPEKSNSSGKKSVLRQRLRHELDSFNFSALLQGVSTIKPEETPDPQAADPNLAAPLRAEESSAATLAEEPYAAPAAPVASAHESSAWAVVRTPANFPGFDLEPRRSANPQWAMASAYARAVAAPPAANPPLQAARRATLPQQPAIANRNRKVVRGRQRRRGLSLSLVSLMTVTFMLVVGVAAALKWRHHTPMAPLAAHNTRNAHIKNGGQKGLSSALEGMTPASRYHSRHRRHRRHHRSRLQDTQDRADGLNGLETMPDSAEPAGKVEPSQQTLMVGKGAKATEILITENKRK
ncbi:MAG TPA: hypothetical protein VFA07_16690 [Chthonomonadaceae bacterium]|nr:hypothetical protein [Chthonomonadaceae bacterium]